MHFAVMLAVQGQDEESGFAKTLRIFAIPKGSILMCSAMATGRKTEGGDAAPWMDRLVDMVLSLLAQASSQLPSAPLRDAVEGLFRLFASQLTSTGALASHATSTVTMHISSNCQLFPMAALWHAIEHL